jgi:hypothetical protein
MNEWMSMEHRCISTDSEHPNTQQDSYHVPVCPPQTEIEIGPPAMTDRRQTAWAMAEPIGS